MGPLSAYVITEPGADVTFAATTTPETTVIKRIMLSTSNRLFNKFHLRFSMYQRGIPSLREESVKSVKLHTEKGAQPMWGRIIRAERVRRHLSQQALAEQMHCDRSLISLIETQKKIPTPEFLARLGTVLSLDWTQLTPSGSTEDIGIIRHARRLIREGRFPDAQLLTENAWWDLLHAGRTEVAEQAFEVWLETLPNHPHSDQLVSMGLAYIIRKTAQHDWVRLFPTGMNPYCSYPHHRRRLAGSILD
jgi:transcriptional regulator with XRE-family HTH domain